MKAILVLMDSLNREYLSAYNPDTPVLSPNITRFAGESHVFDNYYVGSAPCIPARRDLLTGRLNFLERGWGPVEAFDLSINKLMKEHKVYSHIVTDHCHYMDRGGENYLQEYNTWDYIRGQEYDPWVSKVTQPEEFEHLGTVFTQYELNRTKFVREEDYPTPRTFSAACRWLEENKDEDDFFLQVEVFDPHEPFDTPQEFVDLYNDTYTGPRFDCSSYHEVTEPADAIEHLKKKYSACITMTDKWFGKLLDTLKQLDLYDDTMIILTTDHGHLLGEHGFTGKNYMHAYNRLTNIPLMIRLPGTRNSGRHDGNLAQLIDISATLLDYFNIEQPEIMQGSSLLPLIAEEEPASRKEIIYGWFGGTVNVFDGRHAYFRAPEREDNMPLYHYCSMPTTLLKFLGPEVADEIEMGRFLKYTNFPVYKIPGYFPIGGHFKSTKFIRESLLFDCHSDYFQEHPVDDPELEQEMIQKLIRMMIWAQAPKEQYERLGLTREFEQYRSSLIPEISD
jgi:arylsulfatase A-like enzyme